MMIELSWPAKALSPNFRSRSHWPRTRAIAAAKKEAWAVTLAAMNGAKPAIEGRVKLIVRAYPPTAHVRDDDNMIASLKAHRDGIAKALGVDDSRFEQRPLQWGDPVKGGKVVVVLEAA